MSPLAKHFIEQGIKLMQINEYLRSELVRAGFAGVDIEFFGILLLGPDILTSPQRWFLWSFAHISLQKYIKEK